MSIHTICPDCGSPAGQPHVNGCKIERCSACGCQRITCECEGQGPMASALIDEPPPHWAEAMITFWEQIRDGGPAPDEVVLELEDDNAVTWKVEGLLDAAERFGALTPLETPEDYDVSQGTTYADLAGKAKLLLEQMNQSPSEP